MNDDYLWDKSGAPDPEVARLEGLLGGMRWQPPAAGAPAAASRAAASRAGAARTAAGRAAAASRWGRAVAFAAAASIAAFAMRAGMPVQVGAGGGGDLRVGRWVETRAGETARYSVSSVGTIEVAPESRIRIVTDRPDAQRFELAVGSIQARVNAPPRLFIVDTPAARAVDLGCAYTLHVAKDGSGSLRVDSGWVSLEGRDGRPPALVPAGAVCESRPGIGPGTPRFADAPPAMHAALDRIDFGSGGGGGGGDDVRIALAAARPRDSLSVWHLLRRVAAADRGAVYERLVEIAPPPAGVSREAVMALDEAALAPWEEALREEWSR